MSRALTWKRCIEASLKKVKQLYPDLDITFSLRWEQPEGGAINVNNEDNNTRT